jgi:hypothetical protein
MTTIAYRSGIIAADTGLTDNGLRDAQIEKIAKREDGAVAGAAGAAWWIVAFLEWFKNGGEQPHIPPETAFSCAMVITSRRKVTLYESHKGHTRDYVVKAPYHAIGSGREVALGAMFVGAHPKDAIKASMLHNDGTYGRVMSLKVGW